MLFPPPGEPRTSVELALAPDRLPVVAWSGLGARGLGDEPVPAVQNGPGMPLLGEHAHGLFTRPHLRGHRLANGETRTGADWSTRFVTDDVAVDGDRLTLTATDEAAGLRLVTELETLVGGALRARHTLTNTAPGTLRRRRSRGRAAGR